MNHEAVEKKVGLLGVLIAIVISIGGLVEIVPLYFQQAVTQPAPGIKPYDALRLEGRDIYVREGCYLCHSQMIRPFRSETERYGPYSLPGESVYDHPFQFGSKRTGPDLARVGGRYSDDWHRVHLLNPRDVVPESNMPRFPWLAEAGIDGAADGEEDAGACARSACPTPTRTSPARRGRGRGQDRTRRARRLPAGPRHERQGGQLTHGHRHGARTHHARVVGRVRRAGDLGLEQAPQGGVRRAGAHAARGRPARKRSREQDPMSSGWSLWIVILTIVNILACVWLLRWTAKPKTRRKDRRRRGHGPRLGRRPARVQQPAAEVVAVGVLHHASHSACCTSRSIRASAISPARRTGRRRGSTRRRRRPSKRAQRVARAARRAAGRRPRRQRAGHGARRTTCSSRTARSAMARTAAARRASRTLPMPTGNGAAMPTLSSRRSRTAASA